ncbi:hypothetical protein X777_13705 [Ooceraea biroi]|uniref:Vitellogenin domain-containing protein n=1 Tax=Ooceraea biroi TaxID=2015173 RepID=A0A026VX78_OOCBI|nr:hypothetical protein X777_13705 [Ooceraea biroi]
MFLVAHINLEHGPKLKNANKYIFTVNMNIMWTRESINPFGFRVLSQLHCIPKRNHSEAESNILSCSLKHNESINYGKNELDDNLINWRKDVTNEPIELVFKQEEGIEKMIVRQQIKTYDLNVLRLIAEQLHTGNDFSDVGNGTFEDVARSIIGKCRVVFKITRRPENTKRNRRNFNLYLLPPSLNLKDNETIVIDKTTDLNHCTCYAEKYYCKYGNTVVCENQQADLESMTSRMEISKTSFVSSTTRKGTIKQNSQTYNVVETITLTLEDVQIATNDPPAIVNPGKTKILANYDVKNILIDDEQL